jgi:glutamine amidotransferase PdxT
MYTGNQKNSILRFIPFRNLSRMTPVANHFIRAPCLAGVGPSASAIAGPVVAHALLAPAHAFPMRAARTLQTEGYENGPAAHG